MPSERVQAKRGVDAFTIIRFRLHSTATVLQRFVHPSPEAVELVDQLLTLLNMQKLGIIPSTISEANAELVQ